MTVLATPWQNEALLFFVQLSQRKGISQRESLARYRAAGYRVSDAYFRRVWRAMADASTTPAGRYSFEVKAVVRGD